jgi:hypothetical protein
VLKKKNSQCEKELTVGGQTVSIVATAEYAFDSESEANHLFGKLEIN